MKFRLLKFAACTLAAFVAVQAQSFTPPLVGVVLDKHHHLRVLYGMAANFILGELSRETLPDAAPSEKAGHGNTLIIPGGALSARRDGLLLEANDGSQKRIAIAGQIRTIRRMSEAWVQVITSEGDYALRLDDLALYRIPQ